MTQSADRNHPHVNVVASDRSDHLSSPDAKVRIYEAVLSRISDFTQAYDREGKIKFVNQALLDLWGLKLEEVIGKDKGSFRRSSISRQKPLHSIG